LCIENYSLVEVGAKVITKPLYNIPVAIVLCIIIAVGAYLYYNMALQLESLELKGYPSNKGYVSDEVWYVNSARNLLRIIFSAQPRMDIPRASLIFSSHSDLLQAKSLAETYSVRVVADENYFPKIREEEGKYVLYVESQSISSIKALAKASNAVDIVYGWLIGDARRTYDYLNLEHPPLAKYLIALSIATLGDKPLYWRIPSIAMGIIVILFTFLIVYEVTKIPELGLIAAAATAVDPMTRVMSSIAMLDIYVSAFTVLILYLAVKGKFKESALFLGLGSTVKFSTLLTAIPLVFLYMNNLFKRGYRIKQVVEEVVYYALLMVLSFLFFQILISMPIILKLGPNAWIDQGLLVPIQWHLSAKCLEPPPKCPQSSTPWEWFLGINSFPVYASPLIYAQGFTPAYTVALFLMVLATPSMVYERSARTIWYMIIGVFLGYVAVWILGGRTQYSFYAIQLTPLIYSYLTVQIYEFIRRENIEKIFDTWRRLVVALIKIVFSIFR
jgi:predicted membrane-bound dolichyl-phosphate-mannose-protein mannosyltransferase